MFLNPNYQNALNHLNKFIDNGLQNYARNRNFDHGAHKRSNVSLLSPFIKKRILHEKEVILSALKNYKYTKIEKFIQEVFWRTYWKGWLEGRPLVWKLYKENLSELKNNLSKSNYFKDYNKAISGKTGIECFDSWVTELIKYGYLHNHARMWFASIWIFTLNLPWELGADFFYKNLLDGDPASNTLSWRWVAGLHTAGKIYLARQDNIEKYSNFSFNNKQVLNHKISCTNHNSFEYSQPNFKKSNWEKVNLFLVSPNNYLYDNRKIKYLKNSTIIFLKDWNYSEDSELKKSFNKKAMEEYIKWLNDNGVTKINILQESEFNDFFKNKNLEILTIYPSIGYEQDLLNMISRKFGVTFNFLYDEYDMVCWPYAKAGFFKFKVKIEHILENI